MMLEQAHRDNCPSCMEFYLQTLREPLCLCGHPQSSHWQTSPPYLISVCRDCDDCDDCIVFEQASTRTPMRRYLCERRWCTSPIHYEAPDSTLCHYHTGLEREGHDMAVGPQRCPACIQLLTGRGT